MCIFAILSVIYWVGAALAAWMLYRTNKRYEQRYPDEVISNLEYGYYVIGTLLSWITVFVLFFGALASFNELEWDEDFPQEIADAINKTCGNVPEPEYDEDAARQRAIEKMHEIELKAAQEDAIRYKNENFR